MYLCAGPGIGCGKMYGALALVAEGDEEGDEVSVPDGLMVRSGWYHCRIDIWVPFRLRA